MFRTLRLAFLSYWAREVPSKYRPPKGRHKFELERFEDGTAYYIREGFAGIENCQLIWSDEVQRWVLQGYQHDESFSGIHT